MTRKITVSLPDDVAERLEQEPNASAFLAEAARRVIAAEQVRDSLVRAGFTITEDGMARAGIELVALHTAITPEMRDAARAMLAEIERGRPR